jgi:hypothetical protein
MKIIKHAESHIVGHEDGSLWQIYPGDLDLNLGRLPTELEVVEKINENSSHGRQS